MNSGKAAMLFVGAVGVLAGSYFAFVEGKLPGGVLIAIGAMFFALSGRFGSDSEKDDSDAG